MRVLKRIYRDHVGVFEIIKEFLAGIGLFVTIYALYMVLWFFSLAWR